MLLDDRRDRPRDAESVATHDEGARLSFLVEEGRVHRGRVFRAQLEDVPHLHAVALFQRRAAARTGIALARPGEILPAIDGEIPPGDDAGEMPIVTVRADDHRRIAGDEAVGDDLRLLRQADGPGESPSRPGRLENLPRLEEPDLLVVEDPRELDVVHVAVAGNEHGDGALTGPVEQRLDERRRFDVQERGDLLDRRGPGRLDLPEGFEGRIGGGGRRGRLGPLDVHPVAARAAQDRVLPRLGEHHELVRLVSADVSRVGLDHRVREAAALDDAPVRAFHRVVGLVERPVVGIEAVRVLHDELAGAHHAETRPDLVAEFHQYLVDRLRQVPVALHLVPRDHRDDFLVRRAEGEDPLLAVGDLEEFRPEGGQTSALLVDLRRVEDRHCDFLAADSVHLLAHDALDVPEHAEAERQEGVDARGQLLDQTGPQHQDVARDLGLVRCFFQRR